LACAAAARWPGQLPPARRPARPTPPRARSLRGSCIGDGGAIALAQALKVSERLESLNLRRAQLHAEGLSALATALADNKSLKTLDLSQNRIQSSGGARCAGCLAAWLPGCLAARMAARRRNETAQLAASRAAPERRPEPRPRPLSAAGVRELARALRLNATLESLKLEEWVDTFDSEAPLAALATAVAMNKGLTSLSLAGTPLGTAGATVLGPALAANAHLRSLDLRCGRSTGAETRIGEEGVAALAKGACAVPACLLLMQPAARALCLGGARTPEGRRGRGRPHAQAAGAWLLQGCCRTRGSRTSTCAATWWAPAARRHWRRRCW
jgi:hypothetical protein